MGYAKEFGIMLKNKNLKCRNFPSERNLRRKYERMLNKLKDK